MKEKKIVLKSILLLFLVLTPTVIALADPAGDEQIEDDEQTRQMYFFYPTYLARDDVHNWGFGQEGPGVFGQYMYQGQEVRIYLVWTPYQSNFRIGFTEYGAEDRYCMRRPLYASYFSIHAPFTGFFLIRIDNTYGGRGATYDGWYIVMP